jgi:hypothetical protein
MRKYCQFKCIKRFCLLFLIYTVGMRPVLGQMPSDTGYRILSPMFFPGWQAQHISYPFVLYDRKKEQYKMYYAGSSSTQVNESLWDQWVTGVVTSVNSIDWAYPDNYEPVLFAKKYMEGDVINPEDQAKQFDAVYAVDACVIRDGLLYKCWYTGWNGKLEYAVDGVSKKIDFKIGYATSPDGVNWTKVKGFVGGGAVLSPDKKYGEDSEGVEDPYVLKENGIYKMWYTAKHANTPRIQYAVSKDGINWTKKGSVILLDNKDQSKNNGFEHPVIIHAKNYYELWYQDQNALPQNHSIQKAVSKDGISWKKTNKVILHPSVPEPNGPWTSISKEKDGKIVLGNIVIQPDGSCQVFYAKEYMASRNVTYGVIETPISFIYTERIKP